MRYIYILTKFAQFGTLSVCVCVSIWSEKGSRIQMGSAIRAKSIHQVTHIDWLHTNVHTRVFFLLRTRGASHVY